MGGAELCVIKQANDLNCKVFQPFIIELSNSFISHAHLLKQHVCLKKIQKEPGIRFEIIWKLVDYLKENNIDIVYSINWTTFFYAVIAAKIAGVKVIMHGEHGRDQANYDKKFKRLLARRFLAKFCDAITAVSPDIVNIIHDLWKVPKEKIYYIPNGVDTDRFKPIENKSAAKRRLGIPSNSVVIGTIIGQIRPVKDIPTLLEAFQQIHNAISNSYLVIVGNKDKFHELESLAKRKAIEKNLRLVKNTIFVERIYNGIDIYVNSSVYEAMSLAILEAMACGLPVVATEVGGTPSFIKNYENGLLVPARQPEKIAKAVLFLLKNQEKCNYISRSARQTIIENFNFQKIIQQYEDVYLNLYIKKLTTDTFGPAHK